MPVSVKLGHVTFCHIQGTLVYPFSSRANDFPLTGETAVKTDFPFKTESASNLETQFSLYLMSYLQGQNTD